MAHAPAADETAASSAGAFLKSAGGANVVEVAEMVADIDKVEHTAQPSQGHTHSVGSAEAAELAAPFDVRLQIEKHAGNATAVQLLVQLGKRIAEIAQDQFVS